MTLGSCRTKANDGGINKQSKNDQDAISSYCKDSLVLTTSSPRPSVLDLSRIPPLSAPSSSSSLSRLLTQKKMRSIPAGTRRIRNEWKTTTLLVPLLGFHYAMHNSATDEASHIHQPFLHTHEYKNSSFIICAAKITARDSQSSRRSKSGSTTASTAREPSFAERFLAKQTPLLHWQILTFTNCVFPKPCRSLMSMGTLY